MYIPKIEVMDKRNYVIVIFNYSIKRPTFIVGLCIYPYEIRGIESISFQRPKNYGPRGTSHKFLTLLLRKYYDVLV